MTTPTETPAWMKDPAVPLPQRFRGLIFDCDGTLVDTMPTHYQAWKMALEPHGLPLPEDRFYAFAGMPTATIIAQLAKEHHKQLDAQAIAHEKEEHYIKLLSHVKEIPAVLQIAQRESGHRKIAVASGGWRAIVRQSLESIKSIHLFPVIVGADDVVHGKPFPDVFLEAARRIGIPPAECLVYEDGELGFQAARAAGMEVVDVRPWYLPRK